MSEVLTPLAHKDALVFGPFANMWRVQQRYDCNLRIERLWDLTGINLDKDFSKINCLHNTSMWFYCKFKLAAEI